MSTHHTPPPSRTHAGHPIPTGPTAGIPSQRDPHRPAHRRPGCVLMMLALALLPVLFAAAAVIALGEGFCQDAKSSEECARQASDSRRSLVLFVIGTLLLFVVGAVLYARHPRTRPSDTADRERRPVGTEHAALPTRHETGEPVRRTSEPVVPARPAPATRSDAAVATPSPPAPTADDPDVGLRAWVSQLLGMLAVASASAAMIDLERWSLLAALITPVAALPGALAGVLALVEFRGTPAARADRRRAWIGATLSLAVIALMVLAPLVRE